MASKSIIVTSQHVDMASNPLSMASQYVSMSSNPIPFQHVNMTSNTIHMVWHAGMASNPPWWSRNMLLRPPAPFVWPSNMLIWPRSNPYDLPTSWYGLQSINMALQHPFSHPFTSLWSCKMIWPYNMLIWPPTQFIWSSNMLLCPHKPLIWLPNLFARMQNSINHICPI